MAREDERLPSEIALAAKTLSLNEAVDVAKQWLAGILEREEVRNIGLEEISHRGNHWHITLGFSRPWDVARNAIAIVSGEISTRRTYKSLIVDERTGEVVSMKNTARD